MPSSHVPLGLAHAALNDNTREDVAPEARVGLIYRFLLPSSAPLVAFVNLNSLLMQIT